MASWLRLWHDMPTDPKWRVIAKRSGQSIGNVIAVYSLMLVSASVADERGTITNWSDEDAAAALDLEQENVTAIREAMQGKVLDGETLSGWKKRQPEREDYSTPRVKRYREKQAGNETQCNADETHRNNTDTEQNRTEGETDTDGASAPARPLTVHQQAYIKPFSQIAATLNEPDLKPTSKRLKVLASAMHNAEVGGFANILAAANNLARSPAPESIKRYDWLLNGFDYAERITEYLTAKNNSAPRARKYAPVPDDWDPNYASTAATP